VKLGVGVLPDDAEEGQCEILEVVVSLGTRDLLAGRFTHAVGPFIGCSGIHEDCSG
jgi:hypothetical protein